MKGENAKYFDSFGVKYIPKEIKKLIDNKNITTNIYKTQAILAIMCGYFRTGFINFIRKRKTL